MKEITIDQISEEFKIQKGSHKGKLAQITLQRKGNFSYREPHPDVKGIFLIAFNKAQKAPQRWAVKSQFPETMEIKIPSGIPAKFFNLRGLNCNALQIKGNFSKGESHPLCDKIVFHGFRENGKQRWQTLEQYEESLAFSREYQDNWRKENPELHKQRQKEQYNKNWSNPEFRKNHSEKAKVKRDNRTLEQIAIDSAKDKAFREANPEKVKANRKKDYENNKERYIRSASKWNIDNREQRNENNREISKEQREQNTIALNEFYKSNKIPKYLWHKEEFGTEKDLHKALEHMLVKKYGFNIVHEMHTEQGRPDIYVKELDLIIEVKLHSEIWREEKVAEQKARYEKVAETIVVSLDGEPEGWVTPKELFQMIESRI